MKALFLKKSSTIHDKRKYIYSLKAAKWSAICASVLTAFWAFLIDSIFGGVLFEHIGYFLLICIFGFAGTFLSTWILWFNFIDCSNGDGALKGLIIGILSGILAHPLSWLLLIFVPAAYYSDFTEFIVKIVVGPLYCSIISLAILGWVSIPTSALTGFVLGAKYRN